MEFVLVIKRVLVEFVRVTLTALKSYYPRVFTIIYYNDLPKLRPPKAHKLSEKQVSKMRNWRAMYDQSAPQKTVQNMTTKDNPGTPPAHKFVCSRLSDR